MSLIEHNSGTITPLEFAPSELETSFDSLQKRWATNLSLYLESDRMHTNGFAPFFMESGSMPGGLSWFYYFTEYSFLV
ncbi:35322_t:CDS:2 [Gigaspora margarita]|uniref:35322_t:CDS:1 n=1 Tax=Gigaspora margarita TaxID=4874 RepID=A0ABN7UEK3_GIGMA|nr:35322_t:CDS:2 [Gigaspora margarita]